MPASYPGLGSAELTPLVNSAVDAQMLGLTPEDFFVLTRVDGRTSFRDVVLMCGLPEAKVIAVLAKLRQLGAIYLPGEAPKAVARSGPPATAMGTMPSAIDDPDCELSREQRLVILEKEAQLRGATPYQALEITTNADRRAVRLAYFRLSKEFHPDRFYGKRLGSYEKRLAEVFDSLTRAFEILNEETTPGDLPSRRSSVTPERRQRAADLFEEACHEQLLGEPRVAFERFEEVLKISPEPRYLRRTAEAALGARELRFAEEYAKQAIGLEPHHAGGHRILARVFRALGRDGDARKALEEAQRLDPHNPHVLRELGDIGAGGQGQGTSQGQGQGQGKSQGKT